MISATEARALSGPSPKDRVHALEPHIKAAALKKQTQLKLHDPFWVNEGYSSTSDYKEAVKILEGLGYKVSFYYKEHSIAVDMYTIVEW